MSTDYARDYSFLISPIIRPKVNARQHNMQQCKSSADTQAECNALESINYAWVASCKF
jgi:hypothetical protein